jgi:zinc protease
VLDQRIAVVAGAHYMGTAVDETRFFLYAMPNPGVTMETLDKAIDGIVARFIADGVDAAALERAKTRLVADAIYAQDSQAMLARWYGSALATGLSMEDIRQWPARIEAVDAASIVAAAKKHLDRRKAVTGHLLPLDEPTPA